VLAWLFFRHHFQFQAVHRLLALAIPSFLYPMVIAIAVPFIAIPQMPEYQKCKSKYDATKGKEKRFGEYEIIHVISPPLLGLVLVWLYRQYLLLLVIVYQSRHRQ